MNETTFALALAGLSPVLVALITRYMVRADRKAQWERDDEVSRRVEMVAQTVEETAFANGQKLDQIHTLSNSSYTTALEGERAAHLALIEVLKGDPKRQEALAVAESRVSELDAQLKDRRLAMETME